MAHCIVTPEVGGGKDRRMRMWHPDSAYVLDSLWSLTVPFDYDGYQNPGVNYGDCMADAWESEFAKQWQDSEWVAEDIVYFRPFVTPFQGVADSDVVVRGRGIDGDNFCNFAEYRGLMIADDSTKTSSGHSHRRLHPIRKTVVAHVRNDMNRVSENRIVLDQMPGFIYEMMIDTAKFDTVVRTDTLEILFTDSIRFRPEKYGFDNEGAIEVVRVTPRNRPFYGRDICYNRVGAGLWYYGFGMPVSDPMSLSDTIRAVTFWSWNDLDELNAMHNYGINPETNVGITYGLIAFGNNVNGSYIPNRTERAVINLYNYRLIRQYYASDSLWQVDYPIELRNTIAHEFGHTVGMMHPSPLDTARTIMSGAGLDSLLRFRSRQYEYSDSSKAQISVRRN